MKRILLMIFTLAFTGSVYSQKNELHAKLGSGFFKFSGEGVSPFTMNNQEVFYTNSGFPVFGKDPSLAATFGLSFKRITKSNFLLGTDLDYQYLSSKNDIHADLVIPGLASSLIIFEEVNGKVKYCANYLSIKPMLGYRFSAGKTSIDLSAGPEFAIILKEFRKNLLEGNPSFSYEKKTEVETKNMDFRLQIQAEIYCGRMSFFTGYSYGLTNYYGQYTGGRQPEAFTRFLRLGLGYKLSK